jgi:hypothetical protein
MDIREATADMLHQILLGHRDPEEPTRAVGDHHHMREGVLVHIRFDAIEHLGLPQNASEDEMQLEYIRRVRDDLWGDNACIEALSYRYNMTTFVFMPPLPDCLSLMTGNPDPKVIRFNWIDGTQQKCAKLLATDLGSRHFEPVIPQRQRGRVRGPASWKPSDRSRLREDGFCALTNRVFQSTQMQAAVRLHHCF